MVDRGRYGTASFRGGRDLFVQRLRCFYGGLREDPPALPHLLLRGPSARRAFGTGRKSRLRQRADFRAGRGLISSAVPGSRSPPSWAGGAPMRRAPILLWHNRIHHGILEEDAFRANQLERSPGNPCSAEGG